MRRHSDLEQSRVSLGIVRNWLLVIGIMLTMTSLRGDEVVAQWVKVSGPGEAIFENASDPKTRVKFTKAGTYVLKLVAKVGNETASDETTVTVNDNSPVVVSKDIIYWPIEVVGPNGTTESASFNIPSSVNKNSIARIWFRTHNVTYDNKMSFSLNGNSWINIFNANVQMRRMDNVAGGFGGGHSTMEFSTSVPTAFLKEGENQIQFRFNSRPGEGTMGYRVLKFNFLLSNGTPVLDESSFIEDNPINWQPILTSKSDIDEGKRLWQNADLTHPNFPNGHLIKARCSDCHTQDGRDLKYFNYSNKAIVARSQFHGLSEKQGQQIASYIRSLQTTISIKARPWHPPYQPGPGLDNLPITEWAAGAGEEAVLDSFEDMYPYLFPEAVNADGSVDPNKVTGSQLANTQKINLREIPIPFQLPDWNSWLPTIHPMDSTGDFFTNHQAFTSYQKLKGRPYGFVSRDEWYFFQNHVSNYTKIDNWPQYPATGSHNLNASERHSRETYDAALWAMVKAWEVMQEKQLESLSGDYFAKHSSIAEPRSWYTNMAFFTSPNMLGLPHESHGIRDGSKVTRFFYAYIWYHVQAVLYSGQGLGNPITPIDWPYVYGFLANMPYKLNREIHDIKPSPLTFLWLIKANQLANNGVAPNNGFNNTPQLHLIQPRTLLFAPGIEPNYFSNEALHNKSVEIVVTNWLDLIAQFTPDQHRLNDRVRHAAGFTYPATTAAINNFYHDPNNLIQNIFYTGHKIQSMGLPPQLKTRMKSLLEPIFNQPGIPWNQF